MVDYTNCSYCIKTSRGFSCLKKRTDCAECELFSPVNYSVQLNRVQLKDFLSFFDELKSKAVADRNAIDDDVALSHRELDFADYSNLGVLAVRIEKCDELIECLNHATPVK